MPVGAGYSTTSLHIRLSQTSLLMALDMHDVFRALRLTARVQRNETDQYPKVKQCGCVHVCNVLFLHLAFAMLDQFLEM